MLIASRSAWVFLPISIYIWVLSHRILLSPPLLRYPLLETAPHRIRAFSDLVMSWLLRQNVLNVTFILPYDHICAAMYDFCGRTYDVLAKDIYCIQNETRIDRESTDSRTWVFCSAKWPSYVFSTYCLLLYFPSQVGRGNEMRVEEGK
jgi:hypothetical protein